MVVLFPTTALAEDGDEEDFTLKINRPLIVAAGESVGSITVICVNATIEGRVEGAVVVIDGDATITGEVEGDVIVVDGVLTLRAGSRVANMHLIGSGLVRE